MPDQVIIRLGDGFQTQQVSWICIRKGEAEPVVHGDLQEAADQVAGMQIIILVPATAVVVTKVSVPTQNRQRMLKAIPFALEDQFASDVDDLHFAIGERDDAGQIVVAIVENEQMDRWQAAIKAVGLQPHYLIPEIHVVNTINDAWNVRIEYETTYVRCEGQLGFATDTDNANAVLALALQSANDNLPQRVFVQDSRPEANQPLIHGVQDDIELIVQNEHNNLLEDLPLEGVDPNQAINLLQGTYSRSAQLGKLLRPWRLAAALAGIWLVVQFAMNLGQSWRLDSQHQVLQQQVVEIYKGVFPEAKRVPKPRQQMERKLAALRDGGDDSSQAGFLKLLSDSGEILKQTPGLVLKNVRYKRGELNVEIEVPSLQVLDEVKQQLIKQSNIDVEIQSAAAKDDKVEGRLQIKRSAS